MSFEGYLQYWCENGHYHERDAYDDYFDEHQFKCPHCDGKEAFHNLVDVTNGSYEYDDNGEQVRIDGFIEPEVVKDAPVCTCDSCGHTHALGPAVYVVPSENFSGSCGVPNGWVWDDNKQDYVPPDDSEYEPEETE